MMFVLNSDITIGDLRCSGLNEVKIKRSIHSCVDTATIKLPSMARILESDGSTNIYTANIGKCINAGDKVTITLGYNGELKEEFRGFVAKIGQSIPLEIECEGYSHQLKNKIVSGSWANIKLKDLLSKLIDKTDIKLEVDAGSDIIISSIRADNKTALEMLDMAIKSSGESLEAWFVEPDTLKVGFVYLPSGGEMQELLGQVQVKYRVGYNALQDNNLKVRTPNNLKVLVKNAENKRERNANTEAEGKIKTYVLNKMSKEALDKIRDVLKFKANYKGYEGKLTGFLQPLCYPGYKAYITDSRYKDRDGDYLVESVEVSFGTNGARRTIEVGPKIAAK